MTAPPSPVLWTDRDTVALWLGPSVTADDVLLGLMVDAANDWSWRKRQEAGYVDDVPDSTSADVALGATMYAGMLYRERGSDDSFSSFDESAGFSTTGGSQRIRQLLGIGRGRVDGPPNVAPAALARHPAALGRGRAWVP